MKMKTNMNAQKVLELVIRENQHKKSFNWTALYEKFDKHLQAEAKANPNWYKENNGAVTIMRGKN